MANSWKTTQFGSLLCIQRDCSYDSLEVDASLRPAKDSQSKEQGERSSGLCRPWLSSPLWDPLPTSLFIQLGLQMAGSAHHLIW